MPETVVGVTCSFLVIGKWRMVSVTIWLSRADTKVAMAGGVCKVRAPSPRRCSSTARAPHTSGLQDITVTSYHTASGHQHTYTETVQGACKTDTHWDQCHYQLTCKDGTPHVHRLFMLPHTVNSRYLELRYLEFCETQSVYLNQKYILVAFINHNLASETFLQVQITQSAN